MSLSRDILFCCCDNYGGNPGCKCLLERKRRIATFKESLLRCADSECIEHRKAEAPGFDETYSQFYEPLIFNLDLSKTISRVARSCFQSAIYQDPNWGSCTYRLAETDHSLSTHVQSTSSSKNVPCQTRCQEVESLDLVVRNAWLAKQLRKCRRGAPWPLSNFYQCHCLGFEKQSRFRICHCIEVRFQQLDAFLEDLKKMNESVHDEWDPIIELDNGEPFYMSPFLTEMMQNLYNPGRTATLAHQFFFQLANTEILTNAFRQSSRAQANVKIFADDKGDERFRIWFYGTMEYDSLAEIDRRRAVIANGHLSAEALSEEVQQLLERLVGAIKRGDWAMIPSCTSGEGRSSGSDYSSLEQSRSPVASELYGSSENNADFKSESSVSSAASSTLQLNGSLSGTSESNVSSDSES